MMQKLTAYSQGLSRLMAGKWGWRIVMGLFLLEALWFVFSAQYPMAFDENYHFGLIQLHAQQWLPFFTSQPSHAGVYGAIARDPSYLYHWLMSFPYRLMGIFTNNQTAQIIWLRLLNVGMFVYAMVLYRKIVARLGVSNGLLNSLFMVFVLIPVVPFLAATINYDNMFLVAVAFSILLTFKVLDALEKQQIPTGSLLLLFIVLCLGSLIKFPFLPVFAATVLFIVWRILLTGLRIRHGARSFMAGLKTLGYLKQATLIAACLLSLGLFVERYGENIVQYHNPAPACNAVLTEDECMQYGPYGRDAHYKATKPADFHPSITYVWQWIFGMWYRLFFAISYTYATGLPLVVIGTLGFIGAIAIIVGVILRFRMLFAGNNTRQLVLWVTLAYVMALFLDNYKGYIKTAQPVAINGRYLVGFIPLAFAFAGLAWQNILRQLPKVRHASVLVVLVILFLQGGGTMTYIVRSDDGWYWNNGVVRSVNRAVRTVVSPIIIGKSIR